MMTRCVSRFALLVVAVTALVACGNKEEPLPAEPPPAPVDPASAPVAAAAPAEDLPTAEALPVPDDFENEAAAEITEASYRAQLDVIEKDLEAELAADGQ